MLKRIEKIIKEIIFMKKTFMVVEIARDSNGPCYNTTILYENITQIEDAELLAEYCISKLSHEDKIILIAPPGAKLDEDSVKKALQLHHKYRRKKPSAKQTFDGE